MARHAKRRASFSLVPRGLALRGSADRRESGSAWGHALPERGFAMSEEVQPDTDLLRRFLDAIRRQQVEERGSGPAPITAEAIQQTAEYVLISHLDKAQDGELDATPAHASGLPVRPCAGGGGAVGPGSGSGPRDGQASAGPDRRGMPAVPEERQARGSNGSRPLGPVNP